MRLRLRRQRETPRDQLVARLVELRESLEGSRLDPGGWPRPTLPARRDLPVVGRGIRARERAARQRAFLLWTALAAITVTAIALAQRSQRVRVGQRQVADRVATIATAGAQSTNVVAATTAATLGAVAHAPGQTAHGVAHGVREATVERARMEIDERVIKPVKRKAFTYGVIAFIALSVYIVLIALGISLLIN